MNIFKWSLKYLSLPPSSTSKKWSYRSPPSPTSPHHRRTTTSPHSTPIHLPTSLITCLILSATRTTPKAEHSLPNSPLCLSVTHIHKNNTLLPYHLPFSVWFPWRDHQFDGRKLHCFSKGKVYPKFQKVFSCLTTHSSNRKLPLNGCDQHFLRI